MALGNKPRWLALLLILAVPPGFLALRPRPAPLGTLPSPGISPRLPAARPAARHSPPIPIAAAFAENPAAPLFKQITQATSGVWRVRWEGGVLAQLSGARLRGEGGAPEASAAAFLARFGPLLGVSSRDLRLEKARAMEQNSQIVYSQELHGLPVYGSRLNLVFDSDGNIIYLSNHSYSGPPPPVPAPVSAGKAASAAADALAAYLTSRGAEGDFPSENALEPLARLGYQLKGGAINLVYKFIVVLDPDLGGEAEVLISAADGGPISVRRMSRN